MCVKEGDGERERGWRGSGWSKCERVNEAD